MRADQFLHINNYTESRQKAQTLIKKGSVEIDGVKITKPSTDIDDTVPHSVILISDEKYVGRGGLKLEAALLEFGVIPEGMICADIGASTGGFTDCLLQNAAKKVYAFDSGRDQLHARLLADDRVVSREGFNARYISVDDVGEKVDLVVMDVSFISQTMIIPALANIIKDGGALISLVKPQFEAGRAALGKNGIVKNGKDRFAAALRVLECASDVGLSCKGFMRSPIKGGDGNEEYLIYFIKSSSTVGDVEWREKIKALTIKSEKEVRKQP
jgi:23S rRNA (cytidine1920-2'-O)/16S rRNA (cytidine1409-2'-O)-methyltransferase